MLVKIDNKVVCLPDAEAKFLISVGKATEIKQRKVHTRA